MPARRDRPHILVPRAPSVEEFTPYQAGGAKPVGAPAVGRPAHGAMLKASLEKADLDGAARRNAAGITVHGATPGLYVQFESRPGVALNVSSLEDRNTGIEVVAVTRQAVGEGDHPPLVERATVFVPDGQIKLFVTKFEAYASTTPKAKGDRRHEDMLDRVSDLRLATLRALWTDSPAAYPADDLTIPPCCSYDTASPSTPCSIFSGAWRTI